MVSRRSEAVDKTLAPHRASSPRSLLTKSQHFSGLNSSETLQSWIYGEPMLHICMFKPMHFTPKGTRRCLFPFSAYYRRKQMNYTFPVHKARFDKAGISMDTPNGCISSSTPQQRSKVWTGSQQPSLPAVSEKIRVFSFEAGRRQTNVT